MKKIKKILLINIAAVLFLFGISELVSFFYFKNYVEKLYSANTDIDKPSIKFKYSKVNIFNQDNFEYRPVYKGTKNHSILFTGSSYTYGIGVPLDKSLPYQIGELTGAYTINRGVPGGGMYNMLYDLENPKLYEIFQYIPYPKYIVYIHINAHMSKLANPYRVFAPDGSDLEVLIPYEEKDGKFIKKPPSKFQLFLYNLYTARVYYEFLAPELNQKKDERKAFKLLKAMKKITDEKFSESKFIILLYKDTGLVTMSRKLQKKLKKAGFIVLDAEKLAGHELETQKWRCSDGEHPSIEAVRDTALGLAEKLHSLN